MFGMPLKHRDANHSAHHSNGANLKPGFSAESVKEEYRYPREDKEYDAYTASSEIGCLRILDATTFK
jgi:hypothetical protein